MGLTHVKVSLRSLNDPNGSYESEFLVDSGASDSMAPASELHRIGVEPTGTRAYEIADGTTHEYQVGYVWAEVMGESTASRVIFGPDEAAPLLGVITLESLGLTIDPVNQVLKKLPALYLK